MKKRLEHLLIKGFSCDDGLTRLDLLIATIVRLSDFATISAVVV